MGLFFLRGAERILRELVSPRVNQLYATVSMRHGPPMQLGSHTDRLYVRRCDTVAITRYKVRVQRNRAVFLPTFSFQLSTRQPQNGVERCGESSLSHC